LKIYGYPIGLSKGVNNKFSAVRTERDGWTFDSKKEARYYDTLKLLQKAGDVLFFLCQVPIRLPGKTKYVCDFLVFYKGGIIEFVDVKGIQTNIFKLKKRQVESLYPFEIKLV